MGVYALNRALQDRKNHQHKELKMNLLSGLNYIILNIKIRHIFYLKKYFNNFFQCLTYSYKFAYSYCEAI